VKFLRVLSLWTPPAKKHHEAGPTLGPHQGTNFLLLSFSSFFLFFPLFSLSLSFLIFFSLFLVLFFSFYSLSLFFFSLSLILSFCFYSLAISFTCRKALGAN